MRNVSMEILEDRQLFSLPVIPVVVQGTSGPDVISVKLDATGKNVLWNTNGVNHSWPLAYTTSIIVQGFAGNDQINVGPLTSGLNVSVNGGGGSDKINIGGGKLSYLTCGNVSIAGDTVSTNVAGLDKDSIFVNSFNSNVANLVESFEVFGDHLHLGGVIPGVGKITGIDVKFTGTEDFSFSGPAAKNATYFVHSVASNTTSHVFTGWMGNDHMYVGDGDLDKNIAGNLDLAGYYGFNDWIHLNDDKSLSAHVYKVKDNVLTTLQSRKITLPNSSNVVLNATNWSDHLEVNGGYGFSSLKSFNIYGNNGGDELRFASETLKLASLNNVPIYVNAGAGVDRILVEDGHNTNPAVYHLSQGKFSNDYGAKITFASNVENFAVGGGMTNNTFDIVPGTSTSYQLYGHELTPNNGGSAELSLGLIGVSNPKFSSSGAGQGKYTFGNRMPIDVWGMTKLPSLNQPAAVKSWIATPTVRMAQQLFSESRIIAI